MAKTIHLKQEELYMFKHIVMWKLKDTYDGDAKEMIAAKVKTLLEGLKTRVPRIKHLEVGIDVSNTESSYDVVLYSEFANRDDCTVYMKHPEHLKAAEYIGKVRAQRVLVDYEA
jgi:hypothetical protein